MLALVYTIFDLVVDMACPPTLLANPPRLIKHELRFNYTYRLTSMSS